MAEVLCQENICYGEFLTKSLADEQDDDNDSIARIENCNFETKLRDP